MIRALGVLDDAQTPCGVDLTVREALALAAIASAEQAGTLLSQSDLQAALGVDKSNVTRLVQQLVSTGRVEQRAHEQDARIKLLQLTGKGRRVAQQVDTQSLRRFAALLARIPAHERREVSRAIDVLCTALQAEP